MLQIQPFLSYLFWIYVQHPTGEALTSDWYINSYIMVVYMRKKFKLQPEFFVQSMTKNIFSNTAIINLFKDLSVVSALPAGCNRSLLFSYPERPRTMTLTWREWKLDKTLAFSRPNNAQCTLQKIRVTLCCDMDQSDTIGKIELIPSFVLSSKSANSRNDIQLFPQLFDEHWVNGDYH